ncbi:MAG: gliding motility-associated C-terminal domain-containing protein, partial [Bacteroidota bacterium]
VVSNIGCEDSTTLSISTLGLPEVSVSTGPSICMGEYAQLNADLGTNTAGMTFNWLASPDLTCTNCLDPLANPQDTTIYTLVVTGANGCSRSATVQVDVRPFPAPIISLTADTTICANELVQLQVSGGDDLLGYQWEQDRLGLTCYEACINPIATPSTTTTYVVSVTNTFACTSVDSVQLSIVDQAQTFAGEDQSICEGDEVQLQTTMGNQPEWLVINGLDCVHCPDPLASPEESTNYLVRVTTDEGCEIFDSVFVEVFHPEDVDAGDPSTVCVGESIVLNGSGQGTVTWSPAQTLDDPNILQPTAQPQGPTTYRISVDNGACILTDSVVINLREGTEIFTEEVSICAGDSVELVVDGEADQYFWEPLPGLSATDIANPVASPTETTQYQVIASIDNCAPDTAIATVEVIEGPNITMPNYVNYFPGQQIRLSAEIRDSSIYSYDWGPIEGLDCTDCPNPSVSPDSTSVYIVTVTDEMTGCTSQSPAVLVAHQTCPLNILEVPNVFSPNGDGTNDRLELFPTPSIQEIISYRIFDRWGALIYQTTNISDSWDGTFQGSPLPSGVYVFMIEMHCEIDGSVIVKSGDVTLIR